MALIVFVCWIPYLFMLYPGTLSNDTLYQLLLFYDGIYPEIGEQQTDHHPILDTLVMGSFVRFGQLFLGSSVHGVLLYMVLQFVLFSLTMSAFVCYCRERLRLGARFCYIILATVALFPLFPLLCCNMSKDSLFSWVLVLFVIQIFEVCRTQGAALKNGRFIVLFSITCLFVALTKKLGLYMIICSALILFIVGRKRMIRILVPAICVGSVMFLVMPRLFRCSE